jgi:hypothetical protein
MQVDNVPSSELPGFRELGISSQTVEETLQEILRMAAALNVGLNEKGSGHIRRPSFASLVYHPSSSCSMTRKCASRASFASE